MTNTIHQITSLSITSNDQSLSITNLVKVLHFFDVYKHNMSISEIQRILQYCEDFIQEAKQHNLNIEIDDINPNVKQYLHQLLTNHD